MVYAVRLFLKLSRKYYVNECHKVLLIWFCNYGSFLEKADWGFAKLDLSQCFSKQKRNVPLFSGGLSLSNIHTPVCVVFITIVETWLMGISQLYRFKCYDLGGF